MKKSSMTPLVEIIEQLEKPQSYRKFVEWLEANIDRLAEVDASRDDIRIEVGSHGQLELRRGND